MTPLLIILSTLIYLSLWFILSCYLYKSRNLNLTESILIGLYWPLYTLSYLILKFLDFLDGRMERILFQDTDQKDNQYLDD